MKFKECISESPEFTLTPDGKELTFNDAEAVTFIFLINNVKGNLFLYDTNTTHSGLQRNNMEEIQSHMGGVASYGRLWTKSKVLTLWNKLKIAELKELIKECIDNDLIKKEELSKWSIDTTNRGEPELKPLTTIMDDGYFDGMVD